MLPQPENPSKSYEALFADIDQGRIKVPIFQRGFVWGKVQTAQLIDSLIKGYPIGTFIFWKTYEELRHIRNIGNVTLPDVPKGEPVHYVLDGQQRITSLYAVRKGVILDRDDETIDYKDIYINLDLPTDADEQIATMEPPEQAIVISVHKMLTASLTEFIGVFTQDSLQKIEVYQARLRSYSFSTIVISNYPIDIACDIFTRINTGGTELTLFEIMVAKTFDVQQDFDLHHEYVRLLDNNGAGKDLEDVGYETISSSTILQCISVHLCKQARRKDILKLDKQKFINEWPTVKDAIFIAVDYLRSHLHVPVSNLLPYDALLVPFSYFFIRNGGKKPSTRQNKLLAQYFWWASLRNRFSSAVETKLGQDIERIDAILREEAPSYQGEEVQLSLDGLIQHEFRAGEAFCKAVLCLLFSFHPRSFADNATVEVGNAWLKQANSRNYHHFFPKGFLGKNNDSSFSPNLLVNITIVDDYLNKRTIRAKAPSDYMRKFAKGNPDLDDTMKTHLIDDLDDFGIWDDKYGQFIQKRGRRMLTELNKRLEPNLG